MADILDKRPVDAEMTIFKTEVEPNKLNACIDNILMRVDRLETKFADVQPVDRWISVKDSAPEAGVNVLVTDGMHMMVTWCEYVDNQCLWVDNFYEYVNVRFKEVTHWMPLPEFPKN